MPSPKQKLAIALSLSLAAHGLLFIKGEPAIPQLSERSIIHARLDKQDRELAQKEQVGQISQQNNEKLSQASNPAEESPEQPAAEKIVKEKPPVEAAPPKNEMIKSSAESERKIEKPTEEIEEQETTEHVETEVEELVEETTTSATPQLQQDNNISSDSRAQTEALEGSEDPTYTSYRRVLREYLAQRLEAQPSLTGKVRLKIKLEYGSFATNVVVIKSSGKPQLDDWARKAALAANPYPKIPQEIGSTFEFSPTLQLGKKP